ncbi:MAG TPA: 16S rRNA pseudouridine(516) synthase [Clostridiales bacterium UBA8960]|jgi:16S rRNA pseudouridine516 synthase|nr:16S rRNA pseudouridine(516) synthase [Clostridiales bacterium UBA8960]
MGEKIRLDKMLSNMGKGTRSEMKDALRFGQVKVNGQTVRTGKDKIDPEVDEVTYKGEKVIYKRYVYLVMNKPQGVISATEDNRHKTVIDLIDDTYKHYELFPVGRLDIDTEGLLIITNDGELTHNLLAPKKHVPKTYFAIIQGNVNALDVQEFASGIVLEDGYACMPSELVIKGLESGKTEVELTIHEGKFHQVKRMFEATGKRVIYLKRIKMNLLNLDPTIGLGQFRELTEEEYGALTKDVL